MTITEALADTGTVTTKESREKLDQALALSQQPDVLAFAAQVYAVLGDTARSNSLLDRRPRFTRQLLHRRTSSLRRSTPLQSLSKDPAQTIALLEKATPL